MVKYRLHSLLSGRLDRELLEGTCWLAADQGGVRILFDAWEVDSETGVVSLVVDKESKYYAGEARVLDTGGEEDLMEVDLPAGWLDPDL